MTRISRTRIYTGCDTIEAVIPAARHRWTLFLLPLWVGGWLPMGWSVIGELALPGDVGDFGPLLFQLAWLAIWLVGSVWVISTLLWSAFGIERISFARDHIVLVRQIAWFKLYMFYRPDEVKYLRMYRPLHYAVAGSAEAEHCKLAFDYRGRTVCFGSGIDEADALRLVRLIHARTPWFAIA